MMRRGVLHYLPKRIMKRFQFFFISDVVVDTLRNWITFIEFQSASLREPQRLTR